jgi:hypothetical protein
MYLYRTVTYHTTTDVATVPSTNTTSNSDFVNNHKSVAVKVDSIIVSETTFETELTYAAFDNLVSANASWANVKYITGPKSYQMFLVSSSPLS